MAFQAPNKIAAEPSLQGLLPDRSVSVLLGSASNKSIQVADCSQHGNSFEYPQ